MSRLLGTMAVMMVSVVAPYAQVPEQVSYALFSPADQVDGWFGSAVGVVGDVDNDGVIDFAVGAPGEDHLPDPSFIDVGHIYIFSGATGEMLDTLLCPYWDSDSGTGFGISFCGVGDMNGDGYDDILAGAPMVEGSLGSWVGSASVFDGATGEAIYNLASPSEEQYGLFGVSVATLGDIDQDQREDFAIGALWELNSCGLVHLFSGSSGSHMRTLQSPQPQNDGQFGRSVASISDVNGNGGPEVVVGSYQQDIGGVRDAGRVHVFDPVTGAVLHTLDSPNPESGGYFGWVVSSAGDANNDGYDDIAVGAWGEDPGSSPTNAGRAYLFDGFTGLLLHTLSSPAEGLDAWFGRSVAEAGDVNDDGFDDVIVGACRDDIDAGPADAGKAYVFSGLDGGLLLTFRSPNAEAGGRFGDSVAGGADLDGDGSVDLVVGAFLEDSGSGVENAGRAYVLTTAFLLAGTIEGSDLLLRWTACPGVTAYWLYGASNMAYFEPGISPPFEHRIQVLNQGCQTTSVVLGLGDPASNWSYAVVGVDASEQEIRRSTRFGEHDYAIELP